MSKPRPTLDSLSSRFATKTTDPAPAAPAGDVRTVDTPSGGTTAETRPPAAKKGARVQILTRVDAMTRKRLRMIALEQDRTVQDICEEAIRDFVARNHR